MSHFDCTNTPRSACSTLKTFHQWYWTLLLYCPLRWSNGQWRSSKAQTKWQKFEEWKWRRKFQAMVVRCKCYKQFYKPKCQKSRIKWIPLTGLVILSQIPEILLLNFDRLLQVMWCAYTNQNALFHEFFYKIISMRTKSNYLFWTNFCPSCACVWLYSRDSNFGD